MQEETSCKSNSNSWILVIAFWKSAIGTKCSSETRKLKGNMISNKARFDDIIFGSTNKDMCTGFEKLMKDKFQMSYMGELTFFLVLQVQQKEDGIFISLWYSMDSPFELVAYTDSDYAGATQDRKSTTGCCQFLGNRLISWQCKKQTMVATSITKAEYVAAASCCGQVGDEAVHKELGDKMERPATTASSLEAEQDSGSGPRCQDTILGDVDVQTRFETTSK
ncbi:hypothetical protein Tco_0434673 [Tanacetum coccineum]